MADFSRLSLVLTKKPFLNLSESVLEAIHIFNRKPQLRAGLSLVLTRVLTVLTEYSVPPVLSAQPTFRISY